MITVVKATETEQAADAGRKAGFGREVELSNGETYRFAAAGANKAVAKLLCDDWQRSLLGKINGSVDAR